MLDTFLIPWIDIGLVMIKSFLRMIIHLARAKSVRACLQEKHINSMTRPANNADLNAIENFWWK